VVQSAMAAFLPFVSKARPALTIANPSAVGPSYESDCHNFGTVSGPLTSVHAAWGNTGRIFMQYAYGTIGACEQAQPLTSVGSGENGNPQGYPMVLDGTSNTLAVYDTLPVAKDSNMWTPQTHRPFPMARLCVPTTIWRTTQSF
jgi:hypothetical protein